MGSAFGVKAVGASSVRAADWAACSVTLMRLVDAVRAFTLAAESELRPGVRTMNAACNRIWASVATAALLRHWWGKDVDCSYYDHPDHTFAPVFDVARIRAELGFTATVPAHSTADSGNRRS